MPSASWRRLQRPAAAGAAEKNDLNTVARAVSGNGFFVLQQFRIGASAIQVAEQVVQVADRDDGNTVLFRHFLHRRTWRQLAVRARTLHAVQGNQHGAWLGAGGADHVHRLAYRGTGRDHIVNNDNLAMQLGADDGAAFAMVLGFLAVEGERSVAALAGQRHGGGRCQGDALVGGAEQHVEFDARVEQGLRVELRQLGQGSTIVEQARIEEVWRLASGLGGELAKPQDALGY